MISNSLEKLKLQLTWFWIYCDRAEEWKRRLQSLKSLPSGPLQKKDVDPRLELRMAHHLRGNILEAQNPEHRW